MTTQATIGGIGEASNKRSVFAWGLWDWGSAAYNAVIVTFIFSVYLVDGVGADVPGPLRASSWLGLSSAAGAVFIAVLAPALGRGSDDSGARKKTLFWLTMAVIVVMLSLFFVENDWHFLWYGLVMMAAGSIIFELASVPYYAMLRQVSTPKNVGWVSGFGWAMGYLGGIVLLLICYFGFVAGEGDTRGFLNVTTENGMNIRVIALVSAVWFLVFALPLFFAVPEVPLNTNAVAEKLPVSESYQRVWHDVKSMWREDRDTLNFLIASAFFRDGLAGVFAFGAILAVSVYEIDAADVILFGVAANVIAAAGALIAGVFDDRLGPRSVITFSLVAMLIAGGTLLFVSGPLMFWIFGLILCAFVGPAQSASRTYLTRITQPGREGQNFGLYAMTGRAVSFMAPLAFAVSVFLGNLVLGTDTDRWGIFGIMSVLGIGLLLLLRVPADIHDKAEDIA